MKSQRSFCISCNKVTPHYIQCGDIYGKFRGFSIVRCSLCGLGETNPTPSDPYAKEAESDELHLSLNLTISDGNPWSREVARVLIRENAPQPILDIGCGEGELIEVLIRSGFNASGIELRPKTAQIARMRGANVTVGSINLFLENPYRVGTIVISHLLEHTLDPITILNELSQHCECIVVAVPNSMSLRAFIEWSRYETYFAYAPGEHIWQMSFAAIKNIFRNSQIPLRHIRCYPLKPHRRSLFMTIKSIKADKTFESTSHIKKNVYQKLISKNTTYKLFWQLIDRSLAFVEKLCPKLIKSDQIIVIGSCSAPFKI